uniref:Uncharacterized protein n=1 Tax=Cuerna arida TaxID=1464854 RepID=A0A1B6EHH0_9HEMI
MIYRNPALKHFFISQCVIQVAWFTCQAETADIEQASWDRTLKNSNHPIEELFPENVESGLSDFMPNEKSAFGQGFAMDETTIEKRAGKDLHENGKRRKLMSGRNRFKLAKKMRQLQHDREYNNLGKINFTGQDRNNLGNVPESNGKESKDNSNSLNTKPSAMKVFGYHMKPLNSRRHFSTKSQSGRTYSDKKLQEFYVNNSSLNKAQDKGPDGVKTNFQDRLIKSESHEKRKNLHNHKSNHVESENDILPMKKLKKPNQEKTARNRHQHEYKINDLNEIAVSTEKNVNEKFSPFNSDGVMKDKDKSNIGANEFTNLSAINKSFLDAFEKKIYGRKYNPHSKYNVKQYPGWNTTKDRNKAHSNKHGQWIFYDGGVEKSKHTQEHSDHIGSYKNKFLNSDLKNEDHTLMNNKKPKNIHSNLPNVIIDTLNADEENRHLPSPINKQPIEDSKKIHKDTIVKKEPLDPADSSNAQSLGIQFENNEGDAKRSERDTNSNRKMKSGNRFFNEAPIDDQVFDDDMPENQDDYAPEFDSNEISYRKTPRHERNGSKDVHQHPNVNSKKPRFNEEVDLVDDSKSVFQGRGYESKFNEDGSSTLDSCVGYKAEESTTKKTASTKDRTTTKESSTKAITTPKDIKTQTTMKIDNGVSTTGKSFTAGDYEQFLSGQLVDTFIASVLKKVQRSRKISKELGFGNETEDSCDRCVELKINKIPDLEAMKNSLNKYTNYSDPGRCYRVPNTMGSFLKSLLLFEKENENTVYNKILDDSSFIFTGDYGDPWSHHEDDNSDGDNKYNADRDKESMEKQLLKEPNSDDKSDEKISNLVKQENAKQSSNEEGNRDSDIDPIESKEKEHDDQGLEPEIKSSSGEEFEGKKEKGGSAVRNPIESDEKLKGSELVDVFDGQDLIPSNKRQYSAYKDLESDLPGPLSATPSKRRRKNYDIDNVYNARADASKLSDYKDGRSAGYDPYGQVNYNFMKAKSDESNSKKTRSRVGFGQESFEGRDNYLQRSNTNAKFLPESIVNHRGNAYGRNYYSYFPDDDRKSEKFRNEPKTAYSEPDDFVNKDRENVEYQLYPNQNSNGDEEDLTPMSKTFKNDYDSRMNMVKRDTEPYEDELIFFEIPNIEYDLYDY